MTSSFGISRYALNDILRRGIRHVQTRADVPYHEIGRWASYRNGQMIEALMSREDVLPSPLPFVALSQLFSFHDDDRLADVMSSQGKRTLPIPVQFDGLLDGSLSSESQAVSKHHGLSLDAWDLARLDEAERHWKAVIGQAFQALAEIEARRRGTLLPAGDALPDAHLLIIP